jgi:hypothetical protein
VTDDLVRDVLYAARTFRRRPGFVAAAVLSLALGIGANTANVSVVDRLLFRPLPVRDPSRLLLVRASPRFNMVALSAVAGLLPARRASRVDSIVALRYE